ncbi:methionine gamma-lyase family protein, partial [Staphylococcus haemolyticus]|uniref:methionine gamma-lyase family protein n=1 Tax=Staphylococcus haemolyticus TaxID=1283 RepID=UPI0016426304
KTNYIKMSHITSILKHLHKTFPPYFKQIQQIPYANQQRLLNPFHYLKATDSHLVGSTRYGYHHFRRDHFQQI